MKIYSPKVRYPVPAISCHDIFITFFLLFCIFLSKTDKSHYSVKKCVFLKILVELGDFKF